MSERDQGRHISSAPLGPGFPAPYIQAMSNFESILSYRYGFKLAGYIPDQGSGMKRNIGVVANLIKY